MKNVYVEKAKEGPVWRLATLEAMVMTNPRSCSNHKIKTIHKLIINIVTGVNGHQVTIRVSLSLRNHSFSAQRILP